MRFQISKERLKPHLSTVKKNVNWKVLITYRSEKGALVADTQEITGVVGDSYETQTVDIEGGN